MNPLRLLISSVLCTSALAAATPVHPALLFKAADVPVIRARLQGPLKAIGNALRAGVDGPFQGSGFPKTADLSYTYFDDRRSIADTLAAYAFAAAIYGPDPTDTIGQEAKQLGHDYLVGICAYPDWVFADTQGYPEPDLNSGHFLFDVALAYDWLYDSLTPAERQACQLKVAAEGQKMYLAAQPNGGAPGWWVNETLQNHHWVNHAGLGMAALAFTGEISADTTAWLSTATNALQTARGYLDLIHGGAWHEGIGYLNYGLDALIPFATARQRIMGGVDLADAQILRDYPNLRMFSSPPAVAHAREYPIWGDFSGFQEDNTLLILRYVAAAQKDPRAAWYADAYVKGQTQGKAGLSTWVPSQRGFVLSSLLYSDTLVPVGPSAAELDYFAGDLSLNVSRSGWGEGAAMLGFKSGVFGGHANFDRLQASGGALNFGHDHADDMSVFFFADGEWETATAPGYFIGVANGTPQANKTRYANSLLVDGAGQLGDGPRPDTSSSVPWFFSRTSEVALRASTAHNTYSLAQGAGLYPASSGLLTFERAVLFVDRQFPLIRDRVRGVGNHQYDVIFHAMDGVTQSGGWLALHNKNDRVLGVRVLSPASFAVTTEAQTAVHLDGFDPDGSMTAALIHPTVNTDQVTYLTALVPARGSTWSARPTVEPVDPLAPQHGAVLSNLPGSTDQITVVFNDSLAEPSAAGGVSVAGMAGVKRANGAQVIRAMLASGTKLGIDGVTWIEVLDPTAASVELEPQGTSLQVTGDARALRLFAPGVTAVTVNGSSVAFSRAGSFINIPPVPGADGGSIGGPPDAGTVAEDAGTPRDAGVGIDAGAALDAGARPDAGTAGADAGSQPDAGARAPDAGVIATDGGAIAADAGGPAHDAGSGAADAGPPRIASGPRGCGCGSTPAGFGLDALLGVIGLGVWRRRRRHLASS